MYPFSSLLLHIFPDEFPDYIFCLTAVSSSKVSCAYSLEAFVIMSSSKKYAKRTKENKPNQTKPMDLNADHSLSMLF